MATLGSSLRQGLYALVSFCFLVQLHSPVFAQGELRQASSRFSLSAGTAIPVGAYGRPATEGDPETNNISGPATTGFCGRGAFTYQVGSVVGISLSATTTKCAGEAPEASVLFHRPIASQGHGGGSVPTGSMMDQGSWRTNTIMLGLAARLTKQRSYVDLRFGVGIEQAISAHLQATEQGYLWDLDHPIAGYYTSTRIQPSMTTTCAAFNAGLDFGIAWNDHFNVLLTAEYLTAEPRFTGSWEYIYDRTHYSGNSYSDTWVKRDFQMRTSMFLVLVGVSYSL